MTKKEAMKQVAEWTAATLIASPLDEATGLETDRLSDADQARLAWAVSEVVDRLYRMAGHR